MRILCFDIGGTAIKSGIVKNGNLDNYCEHSYETVGRDGVLDILRHVADKSTFDVISISTAGLVDTRAGKIIFCSEAIPNYTGTELKKLLEAQYHTPVFVINDVNSAALGEAYFGAGANHNDFLCLTFGTCIGGAIVINREIYDGAKGYAGEFGHITTHTGGLECVCGGRGCYGTYASTTALVESAHAVFPNISNGREVFEQFSKLDPKMCSIVDAWCDEILLGMVTLVHIFNPSCIVLGGGVMGEIYISDYISRELPKRVMPGYRDVCVLAAHCGNRAGLMGASQWAKNNLV